MTGTKKLRFYGAAFVLPNPALNPGRKTFLRPPASAQTADASERLHRNDGPQLRLPRHSGSPRLVSYESVKAWRPAVWPPGLRPVAAGRSGLLASAWGE